MIWTEEVKIVPATERDQGIYCLNNEISKDQVKAGKHMLRVSFNKIEDTDKMRDKLAAVYDEISKNFNGEKSFKHPGRKEDFLASIEGSQGYEVRLYVILKDK